ncbi:hypothetical protein [Mycolicibacterium sp.]|uniref:hypothetical protein n=1 Tax=Mycolicibacterium sp. TaxID=2320850 RepID=UPI001E02EEB0|nr:hypothetical protein [Mycolicibacterium sp.]MCB1291768.1 hypothetical protein [Mycobacterium sp.]MCB9407927.1 hypothetical protein [Mycolicibacterium sp.]
MTALHGVIGGPPVTSLVSDRTPVAQPSQSTAVKMSATTTAARQLRTMVTLERFIRTPNQLSVIAE